MGMFKDGAKTIGEVTLARDAARAKTEGRTVFFARINFSTLAHNATGSVRGVAETIEAVEAAGWSLNKWSAEAGDGGLFEFRTQV